MNIWMFLGPIMLNLLILHQLQGFLIKGLIRLNNKNLRELQSTKEVVDHNLPENIHITEINFTIQRMELAEEWVVELK